LPTRETVLEYVGGDVALLGELVDFMRGGYEEHLKAVARAVSSRRLRDVEKKAHALKNVVGVVGENAAYEAALQIELAARHGDITVAPELLTQCQVEVERLLDALVKYAAG
jgi:HPt (histidine-containing phosphotransfer) domain-containing protein